MVTRAECKVVKESQDREMVVCLSDEMKASAIPDPFPADTRSPDHK